MKGKNMMQIILKNIETGLKEEPLYFIFFKKDLQIKQ